MIIKLYDSNKEEINPGDIILVRYENPKLIFLGKLVWRDPEYDLILTDYNGDYVSFPQSHAKSNVRICKAGERPELHEYMGRIELRNKRDFDEFNSLI